MIEPGRITLIAEPGSIIAALRDLTVTTLNPDDLPQESARAAQSIATTGCDVAVFGPELTIDRAMATADELTTSFPEIEVILLSRPSEPVLAQAMQVGIRQVLAPDVDPEALRETVSRVAASAALRKTRLGGSAEDEQVGEGGRLITVMAAKGGVGKSTVAVNLAAELARSAPNEVVLVDLNLTAGDLDMMLGIEPKTTIASIACEGAVVDSAVVKLSLAQHSTGILLLAAPRTLIEADSVDPDLLVEILTLLKQAFPFVVVDTAPGAGAALAAAVEVADEMLAIATPELGGLRSLRRNLDGLESLGLDGAKTLLVVNRADHRTGVTNQTIEGMLELPIAHAIPDAREIATAANQSVAYVRTNSRSEAGRAFSALAARFAPTKPQGSERDRYINAA